MASRQKARQFLEVSDAHGQHAEIVACTLAHLIAKAESEGNTRFAEELGRTRGEFETAFAGAIEITEAVYGEMFSDAELDDLILLSANPALRKSRDGAGTILNKILEKFSKVSG